MVTVLVAYATKQGSTAEVAEAVRETIKEQGMTVDLLRAEDVSDLDRYDAVVMGIPLYMGRPLKSGRRFLSSHRAALGKLPLALFVLGPRGTEESRDDARRQLDGWLADHPELSPVSVALFDGAMFPERLSFPFNRMPAGDWRDWDAIRTWAVEAAALLDDRVNGSRPAGPVVAAR